MTDRGSQYEDNFLLKAAEARFRRDDDGNVLLETHGGRQTVAGVAGAFPLTGPEGMISLRDADGREIGILEDLRRLDAESRRIVEEELERSYFMPAITDVRGVKHRLNVVEWDVVTDKGPRTFQIRGVRQAVRRTGPGRFVIKDVDGNRYEIRQWADLSLAARKLIEPYL